MKKFLPEVAAIILLLNSQTVFSQTTVASQLFSNVKTKLTVAEKNKIATSFGFILSGNKDMPFALDKDSKEYPFQAFVYPTDFNKMARKKYLLFLEMVIHPATRVQVSPYL